MALDTTIGGASADSYGALADFKTYCAAMGLSLGAAADDVLEGHLRRATIFLDRTYEFIGTRATELQALAWPRSGDLHDPDGYEIAETVIPRAIIHAQFEAAYLISQGNDLMAYNAGAEVKSREVKAGPASVKTEYVSGSDDTGRIRSIEGLLRGYITSGAAGATSRTIRMVRA